MKQLNTTQVKRKIQSVKDRVHNFDSLYTDFNEDEVIFEASRCMNCSHPTCKDACPINNNIPQIMKLVEDHDFTNAYKLLMENTILPDICGTVCPHSLQCEGHCIMAQLNGSVQMGAVETFLGKWAHKNNIKAEYPQVKNKKVVCIGSGPSSLAFALYLARCGVKVDIIDKSSELGGVLSWGIPSYRLAKNIYNKYLDELKILGASFITKEVGKDILLEDLINNYDAVFIGVGAPNNTIMGIEGENLKGIYSATEFLSKINLNKNKEFDECGEHVVVVGGGNSAIDAARNAIRLKQVKDVSIVYRRSYEQMPANIEELVQAKEEGIILRPLTNPCKFIGEDKVAKIECCINKLGDLDSSGRPRPIDSGLPHIYIDVDTVVLALGYSTKGSLIDPNNLINKDKYECFIVDEFNKTNNPKVYAGGDAVTGPKTVVLAMKAGLNAAKDFVKNNK